MLRQEFDAGLSVRTSVARLRGPAAFLREMLSALRTLTASVQGLMSLHRGRRGTVPLACRGLHRLATALDPRLGFVSSAPRRVLPRKHDVWPTSFSRIVREPKKTSMTCSGLVR
jgi:hypothetical protein